MIRLLIADDHQVLLDGFQLIFDRIEDIDVVATATNGQIVLDILKEEEIDVIMMDIGMPVMTGLEACKEVTRRFPKVKVVALSTYKNPSYIKRMTQHGAVGYLLKSSPADEIQTAIRKVAKGEKYYSKELEQELLDSILARAHAPLPTVTKREKEVLLLLAEGLNYREISDKLFISINTVNSHRKNLISKFGVKNSTELVKEAMEQGIL